MKHLTLLLSPPNTWKPQQSFSASCALSPPPERHWNHLCAHRALPPRCHRSLWHPVCTPALKIKFCSVSKLSSFAQSKQSRAAKSCKVNSALPSLPLSVCSDISSDAGTKEVTLNPQEGVTCCTQSTEFRLPSNRKGCCKKKKFAQPISAGQH